MSDKVWLSDDLGACNPKSIKADLKGDQPTVEIVTYDETNRLGDPTLQVWRIADGRLRLLPRKGVPDYWAHEGLDPLEFLGVAKIRGPIVAIFGDKFKTVREHLVVTSAMTTVQYRFLIGEGCVPHLCNTDGGHTGNAWAFYTVNGEKIFALGPRSKDVPTPHIAELNDWLRQRNAELASGFGAPKFKPRAR